MKWDLCSLKAPFPQLMPDLTVGIFNVSKSEMKLPFLHLERKCYREKWKVERFYVSKGLSMDQDCYLVIQTISGRVLDLVNDLVFVFVFLAFSFSSVINTSSVLI